MSLGFGVLVTELYSLAGRKSWLAAVVADRGWSLGSVSYALQHAAGGVDSETGSKASARAGIGHGLGRVVAEVVEALVATVWQARTTKGPPMAGLYQVLGAVKLKGGSEVSRAGFW